MGELRLRPMTEDEYVVWREQSVREYAAEIAVSRDLDPEAAVAASAGEFAQLLPDGLASENMHLCTAVVDDEPVGIGWFELRQRASGVSAWIYDIRVDDATADRASDVGCSTPCTTPPATSVPRR